MTTILPILLLACAGALIRLMTLQNSNEKRLKQLRDLYNDNN